VYRRQEHDAVTATDKLRLAQHGLVRWRGFRRPDRRTSLARLRHARAARLALAKACHFKVTVLSLREATPLRRFATLMNFVTISALVGAHKSFSTNTSPEMVLPPSSSVPVGAEGMVSKKVDGACRSGPCRVWIRVRNPASIAVQRDRSEKWNR
jgi:hypothetical protein